MTTKRMNSFYIASSLTNKTVVQEVGRMLTDRGFVWTYNWTLNERAETADRLREIGVLERDAVKAADFLIVLLPAGKGSHIELGMALAEEKRVFLYSQNDDVHNLKTASTFYYLPEVVRCSGSVNDLLEVITTRG